MYLSLLPIRPLILYISIPDADQAVTQYIYLSLLPFRAPILYISLPVADQACDTIYIYSCCRSDTVYICLCCRTGLRHNISIPIANQASLSLLPTRPPIYICPLLLIRPPYCVYIYAYCRWPPILFCIYTVYFCY
jgi:hypothetical protein